VSGREFNKLTAPTIPIWRATNADYLLTYLLTYLHAKKF